jgi:hypothetical protein
MPYCRICGKRLTDPDSIAAGIGPKCAALGRVPIAGTRQVDLFERSTSFDIDFRLTKGYIRIMNDIDEMLSSYMHDRTLELTEQLILINRKIKPILGDQFESQVVAWEEAFVAIMKAKGVGIIEAALMVAADFRKSGVPDTKIAVVFACAIELLIVRGKYGR